MIKTRLLIVALVAGVLSLFSVTAAHAAYAPPPFGADAPDSVEPGGEFTVTFFADGINCAWASTFEGQTGAPGAGSEYSPSFTAPTEDGTYTVTASCTWDPAVTPTVLAPITSSNSVTTAADAGTLLAAPQTDTYSVQIQVGEDADSGAGDGDSAAGDDDASNGILPNTGGESLMYLAVGGALVAAGAAVTIASRRRRTA